MRSSARPEQPADRSRRHVGLAALAAGAAAVAVLAIPGTAYAAPPGTTPTNVGVTGDSGVVTLHADSTAAQVAFQIDGGALLVPPADVVGGTASMTWPSWGYANGLDAHTLTAYDCTAGECNATGTGQTFGLSNAAPVVTAPEDATEIAPTGFTLTATSSGGSVEFRIDEGAVEFVAADPYTTTYAGVGLTEGSHTITAVQCATDNETICNGPESAAANVTVVRLHPTITSISPNPFSPNGNGIKDTTKVSYGLDRDASVTVEVKASGGTPVRTVDLGAKAAGAHVWTWDGKQDGGTPAADGTYTVKLTATADVTGVSVTGTASRTVRLDTHAPDLASVTGGGTTFYPYPDRYKDTFKPAVTLGEGGTLKLVVQNSAGHTVRTIQASKSKGRHSLTWNGRNSANHIVAAGKYHWTFSATDSAGNTRTTGSRAVYVSAKRLVLKKKVVTRDGSAYGFADHDGCGAGVSKANSTFSSGGALLSVNCGSQFGIAVTEYNLRLPSAIRYGHMSVQAYGYSHRSYARIGGFVYSTSSQDYDLTSRNPYAVTSSSTAWRDLGSVPVAGHYTGGHVTHVLFAVANAPSHPADFDIRHIRITVGCYVLQ